MLPTAMLFSSALITSLVTPSRHTQNDKTIRLPQILADSTDLLCAAGGQMDLPVAAHWAVLISDSDKATITSQLHG